MNLSRLLEDMVSSCSGAEACQTIELRRRADAFADARLFFKSASFLSAPAGRDLLQALRDSPVVDAVEQRQSAVSLRFKDDAIAALGEQLEEEGDQGLQAGDLLAGKTYMVGFVGPNTSKALHVGHLRNIAVGHAIAASLAAAGARVIRQSLVGDIGRNICEAMAGYEQFHPGEDPAERGAKPDHFVGACYSEYLRAYCAGSGESAGADPIARELSVTEDPADAMMNRWIGADAATRALWRRMRAWTLEGHRATLERLGIQIDHIDCESDAMDEAFGLLDEGLRRGLFERGPDGGVSFKSGRSEFSSMLLARSDGFPTEHARLVGVFLRMEEARRGRYTCVDLVGSEWQPSSALHTELVRKLRPAGDHESHLLLFHGMVTMSDAKMSSTSGTALLIDDLLEHLLEQPRVRAIVDRAGGAVPAATVASIIAKGYFLCKPVAKPMEFSWDLLLSEEQNPGWAIADAWAKAISESSAPGAGREPKQADYRLAVLRAQDFRRNLRHATSQFGISMLTSYLLHLCELFVARDPSRLDRLARSALRASMRSLGLLG